MNEWNIAALLREAEQVRNDWKISERDRADRLGLIRREIESLGGDASSVGPANAPKAAPARATRTSKPAAARKKA